MRIQKIEKVSDQVLPLAWRDIKRRGISASSMSSFLTCKQAFVLYANGWQDPAVDRNTFYGSMGHAMLEKIYTYGGMSESELDIDIEKYISEHKETSGRSDEELEKLALLLCASLMEYQQFYAKDFSGKSFVSFEEEGTLNLNGFKITFRMDAQYKDGMKKLWIMEHKFKSRLDENHLLLKLKIDLQAGLYLYVKPEACGMLYNVIRTPGLQLGKAESTKDFNKRVINDIRARRPFYFMRWEIKHTKEMRERFLADLLNKLEDLERFTSSGQVYRNETACMGEYACNYLNACATDLLVGYNKKVRK